MGIHLWAFLGISLVVIIAPGPDTAVVTKNAAAKISSVLTRPAVKAALDGVTGVILVGLGIRLALERR
jgi:threonine/homoserine/homoserine lactone efflux protein